jgi:hypothetical protein
MATFKQTICTERLLDEERSKNINSGKLPGITEKCFDEEVLKANNVSY